MFAVYATHAAPDDPLSALKIGDRPEPGARWLGAHDCGVDLHAKTTHVCVVNQASRCSDQQCRHYFQRGGVALEVNLATVRETLETNTLAPLRLSQELAPILRGSRRARIVNVSSGIGALSDMQGGYAAYRISKAALNAVTRILAAELIGAVAVNSVCPGWVKTDMGGTDADREVSQGAAGVVWLALDAPQELTGKFLRDGNVIPW